MSARLGHRRVQLIFHPDALEEVLLTKSAHFIKHFALRLNPLVLGKGLLTSEGDFWLKQRRLIQPAFHKSKIAAYGPPMVAAANRLMATWRPGEARDIQVEMSKMTLEIAARALFSAEVGSDAQGVVSAMQLLQDHFLRRFNSLLPLPTWLPTPWNIRIRRAVRGLDNILYRFIRERRETGEARSDFLSILLHARDEDDGSRMTDRQVRDEAMTLFLAGSETTALSLSWTWYLLANHPRVEEKLVAEWQHRLDGRDPTPDDWGRLTYTEQVIHEAMRLFPPAYVIGREAIDDVEIGGFRVPRGTTCLMPQWAIHRDPRWWDEPELFQPERWETSRIKTLPKFAYFPFGGGPRLCIGNLFATMEMVLVLATIGQRYRFVMKPGAVVTPQPTFTLRPLPGVPSMIVPRGTAASG